MISSLHIALRCYECHSRLPTSSDADSMFLVTFDITPTILYSHYCLALTDIFVGNWSCNFWHQAEPPKQLAMAIDSVASHCESFGHFWAKMSDHTGTITVFTNFTTLQSWIRTSLLQHRCSIFSPGGSTKEILWGVLFCVIFTFSDSITLSAASLAKFALSLRHAPAHKISRSPRRKPTKRDHRQHNASKEHVFVMKHEASSRIKYPIFVEQP